jgi:hypothetical protein
VFARAEIAAASLSIEAYAEVSSVSPDCMSEVLSWDRAAPGLGTSVPVADPVGAALVGAPVPGAVELGVCVVLPVAVALVGVALSVGDAGVVAPLPSSRPEPAR